MGKIILFKTIISVFTALIFISSHQALGNIYKNTSSKTPSFSDIPTENYKIIEKPVISQISEPNESTVNKRSAKYKEFVLLSPAHLSTIKSVDNKNSVVTHISVDPELKDSHKIRLILNGIPQEPRTALRMTITDMPTGKNTIKAEIIDENDKSIMQTALHKFSVQN